MPKLFKKPINETRLFEFVFLFVCFRKNEYELKQFRFESFFYQINYLFIVVVNYIELRISALVLLY